MGLPPKSSQPVPRNADLDARDESGWLPVHWAAQSGSVETMCNLHYLGADFVSRISRVVDDFFGRTSQCRHFWENMSIFSIFVVYMSYMLFVFDVLVPPVNYSHEIAPNTFSLGPWVPSAIFIAA